MIIKNMVVNYLVLNYRYIIINNYSLFTITEKEKRWSLGVLGQGLEKNLYPIKPNPSVAISTGN